LDHSAFRFIAALVGVQAPTTFVCASSLTAAVTHDGPPSRYDDCVWTFCPYAAACCRIRTRFTVIPGGLTGLYRSGRWQHAQTNRCYTLPATPPPGGTYLAPAVAAPRTAVLPHPRCYSALPWTYATRSPVYNIARRPISQRA